MHPFWSVILEIQNFFDTQLLCMVCLQPSASLRIKSLKRDFIFLKIDYETRFELDFIIALTLRDT